MLKAVLRLILPRQPSLQQTAVTSSCFFRIILVQYLKIIKILNLTAQSSTQDGQAVTLTAREFQLLHFLLDRRGQVLTRQHIESALYTDHDDVSSNSVEVHVHHLRKKLGKSLIRTVHAIGYTIDRLSNPTILSTNSSTNNC